MSRFYEQLAPWWPLFSPPAHYVEESEDLLARLRTVAPDAKTLLELGSGGGSLAYHLKPHYALTLTDISAGMIAVNRAANPECEHAVGDMRSLRLGRRFDIVLVHDAVMYATTPDQVLATLRTAVAHLSPGGAVAVLPDYVRETFRPGTEHGGEDAEDGRGFRYLEWTWDPDPTDATYTVDYTFMMREASGSVSVMHDRHIEGLFSRKEWLRWFSDVELDARSAIDPWDRDVFLATAVR